MQCLVSGTGEPAVALVDLGVGIAELEVGEVSPPRSQEGMVFLRALAGGEKSSLCTNLRKGSVYPKDSRSEGEGAMPAIRMTTATLLCVGLSLLVGWFWGDEVRRPKDAEAKAKTLAKQLQKTSFKTPPSELQLKKIAIVLNNAHKQITAVTKALVKAAQ